MIENLVLFTIQDDDGHYRGGLCGSDYSKRILKCWVNAEPALDYMRRESPRNSHVVALNFKPISYGNNLLSLKIISMDDFIIVFNKENSRYLDDKNGWVHKKPSASTKFITSRTVSQTLMKFDTTDNFELFLMSCIEKVKI